MHMQEIWAKYDQEQITKEVEKKKYINRFWNDKTFKIELEPGKFFTLPECYKESKKEFDEIFRETKKVADNEIEKGKFVLYINPTMHTEGAAGSPDISLMEDERLHLMYEATTGVDKEDKENFQAKNMCRCFGFEWGDPRFKVVNALIEDERNKAKFIQDELDKVDLTNCDLVVVGGSNNMIDREKDEERIKLTEVVGELIKMKSGIIPVLGICFGAHLNAKIAGAQIDRVLDQDGNPSIVSGAKTIRLNKDKVTHLLDNFLTELRKSTESTYVIQNHELVVNRSSLPESAIVLAENDNAEVEIYYLPDSNTIGTQFHPEGDTFRMDFGLCVDLDRKEEEVKKDIRHVFQTRPSVSMRRHLFPTLLKMAGEHARNK